VLTVGLGGADGNGLSVNVLTPPDATDSHGINVNVLGDGTGENLLDVGLLPNTGGIGLPGTGDPGSGDALGLGPLLSVDTGGDGQGLAVNVLAPADASDMHGVNLNVLGTGNGENLLDIGLLPNTGGIGLPGTGEPGSGNPLDLNSLLSISPSGADGNGLSVNALTGPDATDTDGLNVNVLDTGDGQNVIDIGLPPASGLGLPGIGDTGSGNPLGNLLGSGLAGGLLNAEGGLLNGTVGDLNGSSTGHLIDLDVGPQTPNGLGLDLLSTPDTDPTHAVSISAIDVGADGPQLADLGVLTGSGILDVPSLGGAGTDGLSGNLLGSNGLLGGLLGGAGIPGGILSGDIASGNTVSAPVNAPLDVAALTDTITAPLAGDHGLLDLHGAHIL
jgi:hypothetical protein